MVGASKNEGDDEMAYIATLDCPGLICNEQVEADTLEGAKRKSSKLFENERPEYEIVIYEMVDDGDHRFGPSRMPVARRRISERTWRRLD